MEEKKKWDNFKPILKLGFLGLGIIIFWGILFADIYGYNATLCGTKVFSNQQSGEFIPFQDCLYFSFTTLLTIGYGDMVPVGAWRFFAIAEGVLEVLFVSCGLAYLVSDALGQENKGLLIKIKETTERLDEATKDIKELNDTIYASSLHESLSKHIEDIIENHEYLRNVASAFWLKDGQEELRRLFTTLTEFWPEPNSKIPPDPHHEINVSICAFRQYVAIIDKKEALFFGNNKQEMRNFLLNVLRIAEIYLVFTESGNEGTDIANKIMHYPLEGSKELVYEAFKQLKMMPLGFQSNLAEEAIKAPGVIYSISSCIYVTINALEALKAHAPEDLQYCIQSTIELYSILNDRLDEILKTIAKPTTSASSSPSPSSMNHTPQSGSQT